MKRMRVLLTIATVLSLILSLSACNEIAQAILLSVTSKAVDMRSTTLAGVSDVAVTLTNLKDSKTVTATSDSSGNITFSYADAGQYRMTATKSGWFFIPQTVNIGGWLSSLPEIQGIQLETNSKLLDTAVSFIAVWNTSYMDVDMKVSYPAAKTTPDGAFGLAYGSPTPFSNFYDKPTAGVGFYPDNSSSREVVDLSSKSSKNIIEKVLGLPTGTDTRAALVLDRDDTDGSGPEVVTMRCIPGWPQENTLNFNITPSVTNALPSKGPMNGSATYLFTGVMELYLTGFSKTAGATTYSTDNTANNMDGSDVTVYVVQGSNLIGSMKVPDLLSRNIDLLRVNMFIQNDAAATDYYTYFQFVLPNEVANGTKNISGINLRGVSGIGRAK